MRYVWTDAGDDPDWGKLQRHGIDGVFAPMYDPLTPAVLHEAQVRGYTLGVYVVSNWPQVSGLAPRPYAQEVSRQYRSYNIAGLRMQHDMEEHDANKIAARLNEWRTLERNVNTSWTMEPMQGGWMGAACPEPISSFVRAVSTARVRVVPQNYGGAMQPFNEAHVYNDLYVRGFRAISIFYDAACLPPWWDGFAFTAGRLP